jgi:signal transduction histidine kinase/ligand-binding sensor domain-containing protein
MFTNLNGIPHLVNTSYAVYLTQPMKIIVFILSNFFLYIATAQQLRNYTSYTVDNGLAQNTVWDALQDYKGFMWFGTADGINRFDGHKMRHYKHSEKDSTSILGQTAFHFYETKNKQLWISHNKGISVYNRATDCFYNIYLYLDRLRISDSYSNLIGQDGKGNMWCLTQNKKLLCFSTTTLKRIRTIDLPQNEYRVLLGAPKIFVSGNYLFGLLSYLRTDVFRLNSETSVIETLKGQPAEMVSVMPYNEHTLLTYADKQLYYYDILSHTTKLKPLGGNLFPPQKSAFTAMVWWQGKIWMGNNTGLFVYDTAANKFTEHIVSFDKNKKVGFYYVQNLFVDRSNNLWICTNGDGVKCLSPQNNKFIHLPVLGGENSLIKALSVDANGNIYAGHYEGGVVAYLANGQTQHFKPGNKLQTHVLGLIAHNGYLYYVQNEYLEVMNLQTHKVVSRQIVLLGPNQKSIGYPVFKINNNKVYLSTDICLFEIKPDFTPHLIGQFNQREYLLSCFEIINDSLWWVGTTRGLFLFNPITKAIKPLPVSVYAKSICFTKNKLSVWAGGNSGLYHLTPNGAIVKRYESPHDLPDDFIYGILEDKHGKLWMSHNKGMSVYNPQTKSFRHYGVKDGLQSNEFNTGAYYKDENGLLYFGGVNGINIIDPDNLIENKNAPQVAINEILLGDMPYQTDTAYNEIKSLTLSYLENTLSFDFSALEFSQPENNRYQYRLSGYDNNWIQSGTRHFARYANLPPGNYVFEVMAANADGFWNKHQRSLFISIIPPFWKRTWFYFLSISIGFALIGFVVYLFFRRQRLKLKQQLEIQQQLEYERLRISRDLHDNVGAHLSYLITNIEWMLQHPDNRNEAEEKHRLQSLSEAGRNAILTLRQTIWAISNTELTVEEFADRFKQFALKMIEFNTQIHLHFTDEFDAPKTLSPATALNVFRICQEAFNNCLKHARCKNIYITFTSTPLLTFKFIIQDDGIGFSWEQGKQKGHYGLVNMEARAKETNAMLNIKSSLGQGTQLTITIE